MTAEQQPATAEPGTAAEKTSLLHRVRSADFILSAVLFGVFAAAFVGAQDWPFDAKIFPMIISGIGMVLALGKMAVTLRPPRVKVAPTVHRVAGVELKDEDEDADEELEYVFERATRTDWVRVLSWAGGFFLAFFLVGAIPTILVFTVVYLLFEARTTWLISIIYALVLGGTLLAAQELLHILLPGGVLFS
jgi:hypothetical protein